ncbi:MAG: DNA-binding protein [Alphaproteobacteria bacterium]|nr:DNA-binding protein [Alphaproteobacteria bacterium]
MTEYMTLKETSEKWGIGARRINTLCVEGRIPGAQKIGNMWVVPEDAEKPKDKRVKSGKYRKMIMRKELY